MLFRSGDHPTTQLSLLPDVVRDQHLSRPKKQQTSGSRFDLRLPDPNDEAVALRVNVEIEDGAVSLPEARRLVHRYGSEHVLDVLFRVLALHQAGHVRYLRAYFMRAVKNDAPEKPQRQTLSKRYFRRPLPDAEQEASAQRITQHIPALAIFNARRLVVTYGVYVADRTVGRVLWQQRNGYTLRNPAGFFITKIRQVWREVNPQQPVPDFEAEPVRDPRRRPTPSIEEQVRRAPDAYKTSRFTMFGNDDPYVGSDEIESPF